MNIEKPPKSLKTPGRKYWTDLQAAYGIRDAAGLQYLRKASELEDQIVELSAQIKREGRTFIDRFGQIKAHPLLSVLRDARSSQLQAMKALDFEVSPKED
jgi:hypothetical protein